MPDSTRLNKYLALQLGISRREADNYIQSGKVVVNGQPARLGQVIKAGSDAVAVDGKPIQNTSKRYTYLLVNKPAGYVCSRRQQGENPTVYDLLPPEFHNLKIAGRLDADSCGLLLLTDDGDTIFQLTHPKFGKPKVYEAKLGHDLSEADFERITKTGVPLEDGVSKFGLDSVNDGNTQWKVTMKEGRNRQIRRTFKALNYNVLRLERQGLGDYSFGQLKGQAYLQI